MPKRRRAACTSSLSSSLSDSSTSDSCVGGSERMKGGSQSARMFWRVKFSRCESMMRRLRARV